MSKLMKRIIEVVLKRRKNRLSKIKAKLNSRTGKNLNRFIEKGAVLEFSTRSEEEKNKLNFFVKNIVKDYLKNPDGMLDYIEKHGTEVHRVSYADVFLKVIGEEEGFITPKKGLQALYLNLILLKKPSFKTQEMFILRNGTVNVYYMIHQFHKWSGFKMGLPGFDDENLFKEALNNKSTPMSIEDILSLKEAIARDREAIDFVIELSKEYSGSKKALNKIKSDGSASI